MTDFKHFGSLRSVIDRVPSLGSDQVGLKNDRTFVILHFSESFNALGESDGSLNAQAKNQNLGLGSSSTFLSSQRVENERVATVQQEINDFYSSIDWIDFEEEF
ncbi:hypothetical protein H5410_026659 [Solanum commersonii]|uniref:Uncharacterized protein n=1 Tax=Solanum commersonii TaxID=4109 RepID=A0A9J5YZN5_SOLCO|nr:hypothetical protein H5410_026659 [Solanum commersonii]